MSRQTSWLPAWHLLSQHQPEAPMLQTALRDYHTDTFSVVTSDDDAWYVLMEECTKVSQPLLGLLCSTGCWR